MRSTTSTVELQNPAAEAERIAEAIRDQVGRVLGRRGVVVAEGGQASPWISLRYRRK